MSPFDQWFHDFRHRWIASAVLTQEQADKIKALVQSRVRA